LTLAIAFAYFIMARSGRRTVSELTRGERLKFMLTKEEVQALDDWRFTKRMPSRAAAVRELLKRGLSAEGFSLADTGSKSQDFGMIEPARPPPQKNRPG
jgi:hypothetical protein